MAWVIPLSTLGMIGLWQLRVNLAPCQPLDQRLQRSGCFQTLVVDPKALDSPHFALRAFRTNVHAFAFSPEGELIALPGSVLRNDDAGRDKFGLAIALIEADSGAIQQSFSVDETYYTTETPGSIVPMRGSFSPNGQLFAAHIQHSHLHLKTTYLWEVASGNPVWKVNGYPCDLMIFAPDGQHILCEERRIRVSDGAVLNLTERPSQTLAVQSPIDKLISPYRYEVTAPDRTFKAVLQLAVDAHCQSDCRYVELQPLRNEATAPVRLKLSTPAALPQSLYVSPDSQLIAIQTTVNDSPVISIWQRDGVLLRRFKLSDTLISAQWLPDSQVLALWVDQRIQLHSAHHTSSTDLTE